MLSVVNQLQAFSISSKRIIPIATPSCSLLLKPLHSVQSMSPREHALNMLKEANAFDMSL